jgi:anti-anti-sigma factor
MLKPSVQIHDQEGIMVAEFWDCLRLDPMPVQELRKLYEQHLRSGGRPQLVVDLLGVGFAGSSALGNFVGLHRVARQNGGRVIFCHVEPTVRDVFRASKLESLFEFVEDRTAALQMIEHGSGVERDDRGEQTEPNAVPPPPKEVVAAPREHTGIGRFRRRRDASDPATS